MNNQNQKDKKTIALPIAIGLIIDFIIFLVARNSTTGMKQLAGLIAVLVLIACGIITKYYYRKPIPNPTPTPNPIDNQNSDEDNNNSENEENPVITNNTNMTTLNTPEYVIKLGYATSPFNDTTSSAVITDNIKNIHFKENILCNRKDNSLIIVGNSEPIDNQYLISHNIEYLSGYCDKKVVLNIKDKAISRVHFVIKLTQNSIIIEPIGKNHIGYMKLDGNSITTNPCSRRGIPCDESNRTIFVNGQARNFIINLSNGEVLLLKMKVVLFENDI